MKGYYVPDGYMGYIGGGYRLFADESDYMDCFDTADIEEEEEDA